MTKRAAAGGQSLLISGALKMARGKKAPININNSNDHHHRHEMTTTIKNNTAKDLQEAIESQHNNHNNLNLNNHHLNPSESSSSQSSPTRSTSGFASPSSLQQDALLAGQTMLNTTISQSEDTQHKQNNNNNSNLQQINGKNKKLFPQKLWDLINDERYSFCLRWSEDGQLVYLNRDEFEDSYLKTGENQFHTQKAISFVRQMNMYGFRKVDDCYYENDNFKRGCEHLLKNMTRKHPNKTSTTSTTTTTSATANHSATNGSDIPHFLYQKSTSNNQHLNLHQAQVSSQFINQFQQQQQQQTQVIDCTMQQQQRPFGAAGPSVNGATIDSLVSLFNRSANNSTITSRPMQSMPDLHQPIDLQCAMRQSVPDNNHMQSTSNQNGQQDLNRLIESLAAMSQANLLENAIRQQQQQQQQHLLQQQHDQPEKKIGNYETQQAPGGQSIDEAMDLELDIMSSPDRSYYASNESSIESLTPIRVVTPPIDYANSNINLRAGSASSTTTTNINHNTNYINNINNLVNQDQPLSLVARQSRDQQLFNTIQLFRLLLQFSMQNQNAN